MNYYSYNNFLIIIIIIFTTYSKGQSPPRLLTKDLSSESRKVIQSDSTLILHCPVDKSQLSDMYFEWIKDDRPIEPFDDRIKINQNGVLKIKPVTVHDSGNYICRAINGFGRVEFEISLIVYDENFNTHESDHTKDYDPQHSSISKVPFGERFKPQLIHISKFPNPIIERPIKSNISFECNASGNPKPTITWYHNRQQLTDSESKKGRYSLVINDLTLEDSGNYTCVASNEFGSTDATFVLEVHDKPILQVQEHFPLNTTVVAGGIATFQCRVRSDGPPHIQWLKRVDLKHQNTDDDRRLFNGEMPHIINVQGEDYRIIHSSEVIKSSDGLFLTKLFINNVKESDAGKYVCLGANAKGEYSFRSAFLTVLPSKASNHFTMRYDNEEIFSLPVIVSIVLSTIILILSVSCICFVCRKKTNTESRMTSTAAISSTYPKSAGHLLTPNRYNNGQFPYTRPNDYRIAKTYKLPSDEFKNFNSELISNDRSSLKVNKTYSHC